MKRKYNIYEISTIDSSGTRTCTFAIDIMRGNRFYTTFRYDAPVQKDLSLG